MVGTCLKIEASTFEIDKLWSNMVSIRYLVEARYSCFTPFIVQSRVMSWDPNSPKFGVNQFILVKMFRDHYKNCSMWLKGGLGQVIRPLLLNTNRFLE